MSHKHNYLRGHRKLPSEVFGPTIRKARCGVAICDCGARSWVLASERAREMWHDDHKAEVRKRQSEEAK